MPVKRSEYTRRYAVYLSGLFILGLGIAMIIHAGLGTSPTSSWPYVMSVYTPWSVGTYTFINNLVFITLQCLVLRHHGLRSQAVNILLQLPFSYVFGLFIDINILWVNEIPLPNYAARFALLLLGIAVQAVGVILEVKPAVTMMSMEALLHYTCIRWQKNFGQMKIWLDSSMVVLALISAVGFVLWKGGDILDAILMTAREGTILAALLCGWLVARWSPLTTRLERWMKEGK